MSGDDLRLNRWQGPSYGRGGSGASGPGSYRACMEFRRITSLPPYVFTIIDSLKVAARRDGKAIYYSIKDPKAGAIMERVYDLFCNPSA